MPAPCVVLQYKFRARVSLFNKPSKLFSLKKLLHLAAPAIVTPSSRCTGPLSHDGLCAALHTGSCLLLAGVYYMASGFALVS